MSTFSRPMIFALVGALGFACQLGVLHLLVDAGIPVAVARRWPWRPPWRTTTSGTADGHGATAPETAGSDAVPALCRAQRSRVARRQRRHHAMLAASGIPVLGANVVAVVACSVANFALADGSSLRRPPYC